MAGGGGGVRVYKAGVIEGGIVGYEGGREGVLVQEKPLFDPAGYLVCLLGECESQDLHKTMVSTIRSIYARGLEKEKEKEKGDIQYAVISSPNAQSTLYKPPITPPFELSCSDNPKCHYTGSPTGCTACS